MEFTLDTIEQAVQAIKNGEVIIVVDDEDRENEGDFISAAELVTPEVINFMATHGRGLICTPLELSRAKELGLELMVRDNTAMHSTAFTISVDLLGQGCTTGISAYDRATGIRAFTNKETKSSDYARPGHLFPLIAKDGGVLVRTGHTEAAIDLARLAGCFPAGVLVEILNEDGTMARLPQLMEIAKKFNLKIISIKDLVAYRLQNEKLITKEFETEIDSPAYGKFTLTAFRQINSSEVHIALSKGDIALGSPTLVKVHSNLDNADIQQILFDGCSNSVDKSLKLIADEGKGIFLFIKHSENLDYLTLLKQKLELIENPRSMSDYHRDFGIGAQILRELGVDSIKLITTSASAKKRAGLLGYGLEIIEHIHI
jgi:3,4-dihydroxy 2-butanone 4-phosphate synthase / GTP cyclohydrolase II